MGTKIPDVSTGSGTGTFAPSAEMRVEGKMIKGVLVSKRTVKTSYGDRPVYTIKVTDATCDFTTGKDRHAVDVEPNSDVDMFAATRLERQLLQVPLGSIVTITHAGMKKFGKGMPAHTYEVEVG